jgi:hypothetical protein
LQGKILDQRRRKDFDGKPALFLKECETLGLFKTKMPLFPQLFFHEFSETEVHQKQGQSALGPTVSHRAGMTYIGSPIRLESKSGMSDVWYWYLERNSRSFSQGSTSSIQSPRLPRPHLNPIHIEPFVIALGWREAHHQLHLRKKTVESVPEEMDHRARERVVLTRDQVKCDLPDSPMDVEEFPPTAEEEETEDEFEESAAEDWVLAALFEDTFESEIDEFILPEGRDLQRPSDPPATASMENRAYTEFSEVHTTHLEIGNGALDVESGQKEKHKDRMDRLELSHPTNVQAGVLEGVGIPQGRMDRQGQEQKGEHQVPFSRQ